MKRSSGDPSRKIGSLDRRQKMREYQPPELIEHEIEKTAAYFLVQVTRAAITLIYAERYSPKRITGVVVRRSDQAVVDSSKRRGPEDDPFGPNHRSGRGIKTAPGWGSFFELL